MSDEQFVDFCARHAEYRFESTDEGDLFVTAPSSSSVSRSISKIEFQLQIWARHDGRGTVTKAPSGFLPLCPDVVIEFKLPAGLPKISHAKMQEYMENGAQLGWLVDPGTRSITIYRPNEQPEPLTNFTLHLAEVWNPLQ